ncbi:MAG: Si-specific NAD(P)(+) transhydrogenase [Nitrospirales bacterium]|nr:Si-specific NAD(P)(+) transhydrogenase [Nitrospirales bacterium]
MSSSYDFDLIVIGTGPAGCSAALEAARLGLRVAAIERKECIAGVSIHKGTITSKLLRRTILNLQCARQNPLLRELFPSTVNMRMIDLLSEVESVIAQESQSVTWRLGRSGVTLINGLATFVDSHTILVTSDFDTQSLRGKMFLLAPGSIPHKPETIPFDSETILDSEELMQMKTVPDSLIVVGGGIIGTEYANMFAALGVKTTLIDRHNELLPFVDREIVGILLEAMGDLGVTIRLGVNVDSVHKNPEGHNEARLSNEESLSAQIVLVCSGRRGNTKRLNLDRAGVKMDEHGFIKHDGSFKTHASHIYAAGDVVAFPALASTAMKQGRQALHHLLGVQETYNIQHIPYALYTIPEVSMVGATEEELVRDHIPYQVGRAKFYDTLTGEIRQDSRGMLKLVFRPDTFELLGVHAIGSSAAEIIHVGHAVMELGGTLEYFKETVFNYPTLAECYRTAALNGLRKVTSGPARG